MPDESRPSAVLVVNPNAGRLSEQVREDVVAAVRSRFRIEAFSTAARDSGITIAADAAAAGARLVIAFGGDGHVNEVVNGVAGSNACLGIIPGGTMNVFARALGIPLDPFEAIDHLESAIGRPERTVPLGRVNERYFTFSAGCGFDAEAAERVERYVPAKRRLGEMFFFWSAFRVLASTYRHRTSSMTLTGDFGEIKVAMAIACNAGPYAYLGGLPINVTPRVQLDRGIDVFALKTMRVEALPLYAFRVLVSRDLVHHPDAFYASDCKWFDIHADEPFATHVDGEPLPPVSRAHFYCEPDALKVRA